MKASVDYVGYDDMYSMYGMYEYVTIYIYVSEALPSVHGWLIS